MSLSAGRVDRQAGQGGFRRSLLLETHPARIRLEHFRLGHRAHLPDTAARLCGQPRPLRGGRRWRWDTVAALRWPRRTAAWLPAGRPLQGRGSRRKRRGNTPGFGQTMEGLERFRAPPAPSNDNPRSSCPNVILGLIAVPAAKKRSPPSMSPVAKSSSPSHGSPEQYP